jgi:hypothetical protein
MHIHSFFFLIHPFCSSQYNKVLHALDPGYMDFLLKKQVVISNCRFGQACNIKTVKFSCMACNARGASLFKRRLH